MAIYSCSLASIGRTTHAAGTAGAHLRYIAREGAEPVVYAHGIPLDPVQARTWMDRQEVGDRKNARVADKIRLAIPRELSNEQRLALVHDFVRGVTQDRVPWMFAIHQQGEDTHNPHAHVVIRDRDLTTGKRVLHLSDSARDREKAGLEPKAVEWIRAQWEERANAALERAGHDARIDRRTLEAQGIDREPTIHLGPRGQHIDRRVQRPTSRKRYAIDGREIDYPSIDQGRTRQERNAEIVDLNLERAARSPEIETRLTARFEREQLAKDRALEGELAKQARVRTNELRTIKARFRSEAQAIRAERGAAYQAGVTRQRGVVGQARAYLRERHDAERQELRRRHRGFWGRFTAAVDITGGTRRRQAEVRAAQVSQHQAERAAVMHEARAVRATFKEKLALKYKPRMDALIAARTEALSAWSIMQTRWEAAADARRQLREVDRECERVKLSDSIRDAKVHSQALGGDEGVGVVRTAFRGIVHPDERRRAELREELARRRGGDRGPSQRPR